MYPKMTCMTVNLYFRFCWRLLDVLVVGDYWLFEDYWITACFILRVITVTGITGMVITEIVIRSLFPFLPHYVLNRSYSFVLLKIFVQSIRYSIFRRVSFLSSYSLFLASVSIISITVYLVINYLLLFLILLLFRILFLPLLFVIF